MRLTHTWRRSTLALLGCLLVGLLAVQSGLATPTAQRGGSETPNETVSIVVTNATMSDEDTRTLELRLTRAPDGLAGFQLTAVLETRGIATVTNASYPKQYGLTTEPAITPDGQSVTLEAADLSGEVTAGATDVLLASVTVSGADAGETQVALTDVQVDADGGARVDAATEPGVVRVGSDGTTGSEGTSPVDSTRNGATDSDTNPESNSGDAGPTPGVGALTLFAALLVVAGLLARRTR